MRKIPTDIFNLITNAWMTPLMKKMGKDGLPDEKYKTGNIMNLFDRDVDRLYAGLTVIKNALYPIFLILINFIFLQALVGLTALFVAIFYFILLVPIIYLEVIGAALNTSFNILQDSRGNMLREIFKTYLYLDIISGQIASLKNILANVLNIYEAYQLISDYLLSKEICATRLISLDDTAIKLEDVTWKWQDVDYIMKMHNRHVEEIRYIGKKEFPPLECKENANTFELKDWNISIKKGSLIGVVGAVGSGKSTLFEGLTSQLKELNGNITLNGQVAYYRQNPWIMIDDIQTNIVFGKEFNGAKLERIINACGLVQDLNALEDGVRSKLGESGINLSGGQKSRVSLARCLYADADIYLLDDPLSALDAHVGRLVFEKAIKTELAGKTVLLATHQLQYMQHMDQIIVIENGKIVDFGTYDALINNKIGVFKKMVSSYAFETLAGFEDEDVKLNLPLSENSKLGAKNFVKVEKKQRVNVSNLGKYPALRVQKILLAIAYSLILYVRDIYDKATLEIKRSFSLYQSAANSIKVETIAGLPTINSFFGGQEYFEERYHKFFDRCSGIVAMVQYNNLWYQFRVKELSSLISIGVVIGALVSNQRSTFFSATAGLAITQSESCANELIQLIVSLAQNKSTMNSFERILDYCYETEQEAPAQMPNDTTDGTWPSKGVIEINSLVMAYHSKPESNILRDLSVSILPAEKVGVVGRTGSGKSTLALAFFRILEPKSGTILIDGIGNYCSNLDIGSVGLSTLRKSIHIISQEASLFPGTIRYNLCLDDSFTDEELWNVLEMVGLKDYVSQLPDKLEHELIGNASNLSAGQGQLLCLARAIAKKPKVLILDEASSSIDVEADKKLQSVLRSELNGTTIISIAHRLNTIADFDRVLVLDQGEMREYDSPYQLLQNSDSEFSKLVEASGPANAQAIREIAFSKYQLDL
ncbi:hypothetical protein HDV01_003483 [Terramyces sp. JEL0728]|nr:hypothetical protein HDV01_003483 [Terramyces sp. JEL0728]